MANDLEFTGVVKRFGDFTAVHNLDLVIREGEFFSFLGPSGCGKTTILRMVSGFIDPSEGRITLGGQDLLGTGPNKRPTALIFQNLALFPLMTVAENIGFGLEVRRVPAADRRRKVEQMLDLIALPGFGGRRIDELSGGQKQRVAIARALAVEPKVLLLDEPLSALDLKLRQHMRAELRAIQRKTGVTFIYITHDQGEALTMSDRIAVMNNGVIEQVGSGDDIYSRPVSPFVASFVGEVNQFRGRVAGLDGDMAWIDTAGGRLLGRNPRGLAPGDAAILFVRPEQVGFGEHFNNRLHARLTRRDLEGACINYEMTTGNGQRLARHQTNTGAIQLAGDRDQPVGFACEAAVVLPDGAVARTGTEELAAE